MSSQLEANKTEKFNTAQCNSFCLYQITWLAAFSYLTLKFDKIKRQGSLCLDVASPDQFCTFHIDFILVSKNCLCLQKHSAAWCVFQAKNIFPPKDTHLVWRWRKVQVTTQEVITAETVAISLRGQIWTYESSCWMPCFHANVPSDNGLCSRSLANVQFPPLFYHADIWSTQQRKRECGL